jgi:site-specific DNA recombinase
MQVSDGISLETQERAILLWALQHSYVVRLVERDEGVSGKSMKNRLGLVRAMEAVMEGEALVVYSLSRFARNVSDTVRLVEQLKKKKADLASATEPIDTVSITGQLMLNILASFAQFEGQQTAQRVKAALGEKKRRKEWVGRPPIGWKIPGEQGSGLVEDPWEQNLIAYVRAERELEDDDTGKPQTYEAIAQKLNEAGVPPLRKSTKWYRMQVQRMCTQKPIENMRGRADRHVGEEQVHREEAQDDVETAEQ